MSVTVTNSASEARAFSLGPVKAQIVDLRANSGATSGSLTADGLKEIFQLLMGAGGSFRQTSAPVLSGNSATLAFTVPAETAASLIVQDLTYTAVANLGAAGNSITIAYTGGGTAGSEVVSVVGNAISIQIDPTPVTGSTATQVKAAFDAAAAAIALASCAVSGTGSTVQTTASATPLAGGVTGGAFGSVLCIGR